MEIMKTKVKDYDSTKDTLKHIKRVKFYRKQAKKNATSLVWHMNWLKKFILII